MTQQQNEEYAENLGAEYLMAYLEGYENPDIHHVYCGCSQDSKLLIKWWLIGQKDSQL